MRRESLDSCIIIYSIEGVAPFQSTIMDLMQEINETQESILLTSRLAMLECRTRPLRDGDTSLLHKYDGFFSAKRLMLIEVDSGVLDTATRLRAKYGYRTPDAIHLASALEAGADLFITGDAALKDFAEVPVHLVSGSR